MLVDKRVYSLVKLLIGTGIQTYDIQYITNSISDDMISTGKQEVRKLINYI